MIIDAATAQNIVGQLATVIAAGKWPLERPPPNMMRGVDFYTGTELLSALVLGAHIFKGANGFLPHLAAPTTFNEVLFVRKFFAPLPMPSLGDKLGVRDHVRQRLGDSVLIPVVWAGDSAEELFAARLPTGRFVLKGNHGAGMNLFLDLPQDLVTRRDEIVTTTRDWLDNRFGFNWGEWHYNVFPRRLFLEAFLGKADGQSMDDLKIHCFHGKAKLIQLVTGRFTQLRLGQYTPDWRRIAVGMPGYDSIEVPRPGNLEAVIATAERLAHGLDYARIDLYATERAVWFGEITLTPGNGSQQYSDFQFGRWLGGLFEREPAQPEWDQ